MYCNDHLTVIFQVWTAQLRQRWYTTSWSPIFKCKYRPHHTGTKGTSCRDVPTLKQLHSSRQKKKVQVHIWAINTAATCGEDTESGGRDTALIIIYIIIVTVYTVLLMTGARAKDSLAKLRQSNNTLLQESCLPLLDPHKHQHWIQYSVTNYV